MIVQRESQAFKVRFYGALAVGAWLIALVLNKTPPSTDLIDALRMLGFATIAATFVAWIFNKWLWRLPLFNWIVGVPDFSGRWEGWFWNSLGKRWEAAVHEVSQSAFEVTANGWGPVGWSRSFCAALIADSAGRAPELVYTYHNEKYAGHTEAHTGTCKLRMEKCGDTRYLVGTYYTDRTRDDNTIGQGGYVRLAYAGAELRDGFCFDEGSWKMPRPTDVPRSGFVSGDGDSTTPEPTQH